MPADSPTFAQTPTGPHSARCRLQARVGEQVGGCVVVWVWSDSVREGVWVRDCVSGRVCMGGRGVGTLLNLQRAVQLYARRMGVWVWVWVYLVQQAGDRFIPEERRHQPGRRRDCHSADALSPAL